MLTAMTSTGQIIQFPADFRQELDDAPEEKLLEILPRKMAEFFAILATSALPNDSVETEGPYIDSCGVDVVFHLIDSCDIGSYKADVVGTFYAYNFDHAKIYINSLKGWVESHKGPAESPMEVTIGEPYPLTEEQAVQHAQDICNRRFVVDKEKGSFIGTYRPSTDSDPGPRPEEI